MPTFAYPTTFNLIYGVNPFPPYSLSYTRQYKAQYAFLYQLTKKYEYKKLSNALGELWPFRPFDDSFNFYQSHIWPLGGWERQGHMGPWWKSNPKH
jgi:hypothetical protein